MRIICVSFFIFFIGQFYCQAQSLYWNGQDHHVDTISFIFEDSNTTSNFFNTNSRNYLLLFNYNHFGLDSIGLIEVDENGNSIDYFLIIQDEVLGGTIFSELIANELILSFMRDDNNEDNSMVILKQMDYINYDIRRKEIISHLVYDSLLNQPNTLGRAGRSVRRDSSLFTFFPFTPDTLRYIEVSNMFTNPVMTYHLVPKTQSSQQNISVFASVELHGNGRDFIYWSTSSYGIIDGDNIALPDSSQVAFDHGEYYRVDIGEIHWIKENNTIVQMEAIRDWPEGEDIQAGILFKLLDSELNLISQDTFFEESSEVLLGVLPAALDGILEDKNYLYFLATDDPATNKINSTYVFKYTKDLNHVSTTKYAMPDNFYILGSKLIEDKGLMIWGHNYRAEYWDRISSFYYLIDSIGVMTNNKEALVQMEYSISSNPGRDYFSITLGNDDLVGMDLVVTSSIGQMMYTIPLEYGENVINTSSWAIGSYYYTLIDKRTGRKQTGKWIKI